jgi:hypothetical protein
VSHGSALLVLPLAGLPALPAALVAMLVAWSAHRAWRLHVSLEHPAAIRRLQRDAGGAWRLTRTDAGIIHAPPPVRVFLHPRLVILRFRHRRWRRCSVLLTPDRLEPATFRRLRVGLLVSLPARADPVRR